MGLDVHMRRYTVPMEEFERREAEAEAISTAVWDRHNKRVDSTQWTEADRKAWSDDCEASYTAAGFDKDGGSSACEDIEFPSAKYPNHYFKIGYLRSSYNSNGINSVFGRLGLADLNAIFDRTDDSEYRFRPDWAAVKSRTVDVLRQYRGIRAKPFSNLDIEEVRAGFCAPLDGTEASLLAQVREELTENAKRPAFGGGGYSNVKGQFFPDGRTIHAIVRGKPGFLGTGVYFVTSIPKNSDGDFYEQALEILIETCDWALAQPQESRDQLYLHWSS